MSGIINFMRVITIAILFAVSLTITCLAQDKIERPVTVKYQIEKINSDEYRVLFIMSIKEPYKVVSPDSPDNYWLKPEIYFRDSTNLLVAHNWIEEPTAIVEFDSLINEPVRVHRKNVVYSKIIKFRTGGDFDIDGEIRYEASMALIDKNGIDGKAFFCENSFKIQRRNGKVEILEIM
jgi:hypothetical protein